MRSQLLTIGDLARKTGVATSALRYYEEVGLLEPDCRQSGQRRYPLSAVEHVGVLLFLRDVGFSLTEIGALIASRSASPDAWRELARRKLAEVESQIAKQEVARVALQHALRCHHDDLLNCENFRDVVAHRLSGKPLAEAHSHVRARC
jgi:DNA-binding transcriptional MerR regulator